MNKLTLRYYKGKEDNYFPGTIEQIERMKKKLIKRGYVCEIKKRD